MDNKYKKSKIFEKETYIKKYGKNSMFAFVVLSAVFLVFLIPKIYGFYGSIYFKQRNDIDKNKYVQKEQTLSEINYEAGMTFLDEKNYSLALESFEKAVAKEPDNINYLTEYASINYRLKKYDQAIEVYKKIIAIDENSAFSYNSIGNIYWIIENRDEAENNFKKAIEIDPSLISVYNNYALMLDEKGQSAEAIEILQQGIELNSENNELKLTKRLIERNNK